MTQDKFITYAGVPLEDMTKEELIKAIHVLHEGQMRRIKLLTEALREVKR